MVRAVASADVDALRCLYDRHVPWLVARLRSRCSDDVVVADAVEDTFLAAWNSDRPSSVVHVVVRAAGNRAPRWVVSTGGAHEVPATSSDGRLAEHESEPPAPDG
jgi:DNA-directed RNA polymerase specialized sigma24 family protein